VLVQPDVAHLVQDRAARRRVHQIRAQVDPAGERVSEVPAQPDSPVEVDLDLGHLSPARSNRLAAHRVIWIWSASAS
jgi:hypothetical protein